MNEQSKRKGWRWLWSLGQTRLSRDAPDTWHEMNRIRGMERNLGLPIKVFLLVFLGHQLLLSHWFDDLAFLREAHIEVVQFFFALYALLNVLGGVLVARMDRLPPAVVRETVLVLCLLDALFLGALTVVTGGFDSILFWVFPMLIVRTVCSVPHTGRQILLNLLVTGCYLAAGWLEGIGQRMEWEMLDPGTQAWLYPEGIETPTEPS